MSAVRVGNFRDHFLAASDLISAASVELKIILVTSEEVDIVYIDAEKPNE